MELGIQGKKALLCASNAGLGLACAKAVAAHGADVFINGRNIDKIAAAEAEVKSLATGEVRSVRADVSTDEGREALLSVCPDPDILLNNNAGAMFAFLCSQNAGYVSGSNIHLDGGSYPGLV